MPKSLGGFEVIETNAETQEAGPKIVPCGHEADSIALQATNAILVYCQRCERGFELAPMPA